MIKKTFTREQTPEAIQAKGFDDYVIRLGDLMRGERATMGKSLLDVQRDLKIKAAYVAAIENADPAAFDTPGFIAGYVRSYARYLGLDPDDAFEAFCAESGFATAHGMSAQASSRKAKIFDPSTSPLGKDIFAGAATPFAPLDGGVLSGADLRGIGSVMVVLGMVVGLGWGGLTVLQEVQKVQFAPVDQTPVVVSQLDPLSGVRSDLARDALVPGEGPSLAALDRLYRPEVLDVPVLVARDAPIAALDPDAIGAFPVQLDAAAQPDVSLAQIDLPAAADPTPVEVVGPEVPQVQLVAVRPAWVRVRAADGTVIYEGVMAAGENFVLPATEDPATLRVGESGAMYFAVNGQHYGPVGAAGTVTANVALSTENLTESFALADLAADADLAEWIRVAQLAEQD